MTATLIGAADPDQPTPDPQPITGPWQPRWCCELARYGDVCDCAVWATPIIGYLRRARPVTL